MPFGWKRNKSGPGADEYTIEDLIVLERYDDAIRRLKKRLKERPTDHRGRMLLADTMMKSGDREGAVGEYVVLAEAYGRDGFHDKALALLSKVKRIAPHDEKIPRTIRRLHTMKLLDRRRGLILKALQASHEDQASAFDVERTWAGLSRCPLVHRLDEDTLQRTFGAMRVERRSAGTEIFREGAEDRRMVVVAGGAVEVTVRTPEGESPVLRELIPGDVLGARALLEHEPWPADYRVSKDAVVLELDGLGLEHALGGSEDPRGFLEILRDERSDHEVAEVVRRYRDG